MNAAEPANSLEEAILAAKSNALPMKVLAGVLLGAKIILPSVSDPGEDLSGFQPLIFNKESNPMVAAFSHDSRLADYKEMAPFLVEVPASSALQRLPRQYGVFLNANSPFALQITAEGVVDMLRDFGLLPPQ